MKPTLNPSRRRGGFTLVELLAVIAILGILMGAVASSVPSVLKRVRQNEASSNLRQILTSYKGYLTANDPISLSEDGPKNGGAQNPAQFAEVLARKANFNDGKVWYIEQDKKVEKATGRIPAVVLDKEANQLSAYQGPIAWAVVIDAKKSGAKDGKSTYPLMWTRGLSAGGEWKDDAPWGTEGGHIAFADGHVAWFDNVTANKSKLRKYDDESATSSYQDAIGEGAQMKEDTK
jgi:prepilin-type N-terminal cleavage/methylation domain-containing protein/prepilin-type processing-associated H-X9-DG protein